jgi:small subunit ribosomal protein S8e
MDYGRKITGGKYHKFSKREKHRLDSQETPVSLGEEKRKKIRVHGGIRKLVLLKGNQVNLVVKGKVQKTTIKNVLQTPQNNFLARQNRLSKGAIIETPLGKARITNRPSQEGHVNAISIEA